MSLIDNVCCFTERVVDYTMKVLFPLAPLHLQLYYCQHSITTSGDYYSMKIQQQQQQVKLSE